MLPLAVAIAAGCGAQTAKSNAGHDSSRTSLTISVTAKPGAKTHTWKLRCDPVGGDLPRSAKACSALANAKKPFAPVPKGQMCPQIYGGPQKATITGTYRGHHVNALFSRANGCETHRWNKLAPLLNTHH